MIKSIEFEGIDNFRYSKLLASMKSLIILLNIQLNNWCIVKLILMYSEKWLKI